MFHRSAFYSFAKYFARAIYRRDCRVAHKLQQTQIIDFTALKCAPEIKQIKEEIAQIRPESKKSNEFRANYTQSYPAATKRNGGLRGSQATKGRL